MDELARFGGHLVCPECKDAYTQKLREGARPSYAHNAPMEYAGFWIRLVASFIDGIILIVANMVLQYTVLLPLMGPLTQAPGTDPAMALLASLRVLAVYNLVSMTIGCCYEAFFVNRLGATPGKMALGLKVVRPDGGPVDLGRAFGRYFAKLLSAMILCIGYIMAGIDSEKRGLHDMICGTRVIKRPS
jgi:uncharacterized RDD family membrane protein YckC